MDPLTNLYERLCEANGAMKMPAEPPQLEDWLRYWNDEDSDLGNLRNIEHWLTHGAQSRAS